MDDFPDPVVPTNAVVLPPGAKKEMPLRILSTLLYAKWTLSNLIE